MSNAKSAFNTQLKIHDGVSTYTTIAENTTVTVSGPTVNIIDVTNHDSPSSYKEKIAGLIDAGQLTWDGNWVPQAATQAQCRTDMNARTRRLFQILYPTSPAKTHSFAGYITQFAVGAATPDGKLTVAGQVEIDGPIVET